MNCFFVPAALIGLLTIHRIQIETKTEEVEKLSKTNAFILFVFLCEHKPRACACSHINMKKSQSDAVGGSGILFKSRPYLPSESHAKDVKVRQRI